MRILLVTPENRFIRAFRRGQVNNFAQLTMPYLAGFVGDEHEVSLHDEYDRPLEVERDAEAADLVAITCNTPNAPHIYSIADRLRRPGRQVVLGGPHVTLLPDEAAPYADAVVIGEAEETWPRLLADAAAGRLRRRYQAMAEPKLERLPRPRYDLVRGRWLLGETIFATRGCPHTCGYCNLRQIYGPTPRFRPVGEVVAQVRSCRSPLLAFWDDQLFMDRDYAMRLCESLVGLNKRWAAMATLASTVDERLLAAAARAGCTVLFLGLESMSGASLASVEKTVNVVAQYREGVARIHRHGIAVQAGIVFGFDGDEASTFERTWRECEAMGLDGATVSILAPFPGTPLFDQFARDGRLLTRDWSYYNGKTAVAFAPRHMGPEDLWNGYMQFRRRFYSTAGAATRRRQSGVHGWQARLLGWGYRRAIDNVLPGWPVPAGARTAGAVVDWPGASLS